MDALAQLLIKPEIATIPCSSCVVCGGIDWRWQGASQDYEYATCSNVWSFQSCVGCGHVQIHAMPAPETLGTIYPDNYYSYIMEQSVHPFARWAKQRMDRAKFRWIVSGRPVESYLDVGCGDGRYLQMMLESGAKRSHVHGVELDSQAVASARAKGLHVTQSRIEDARNFQAEYFDLVTMFHVIEHVARPDDVVRRLRDLLKVGGILALETPNFDCLDARLAGKRFWGGYHTPRHWHVFTAGSLIRLLTDSGFTVVRVRYQTGHAFLLWTLHHWLKYGKGFDSVARWCHPLRNIPLLAAATSLDMLRIALGRKTSAMLVVARKER